MNMLEYTTLKNIVKGTQICFDPDDLNTLIEEDKDLIEQYKEFEKIMDECNNTDSLSNNEKSKWILRIEMNQELMLDKNITMDDVHYVLKTVYEDQISCIYSDYNADKLIFRIRMTDVLKSSTSKSANKKKCVVSS